VRRAGLLGLAPGDGVGGLYRYFESLFTDGFTLIVDADDGAVAALTGLAPEDAARTAAAALRAGKVVVDHPRYLDGGRACRPAERCRPREAAGDGRVRLAIRASSRLDAAKKDGTTRMVTVPGFALPHPGRAPLTMMTGRTASTLGMGSVASLVLATTSRMPTQAEEDRLEAELLDEAGVYVERGARLGSDTRSLLLLAVVAGAITLGAAAIATGLAAADGRADLGTLAAVGASPRVRRALSLSQSGVIAGLGSVLGAAAGLGGAVAMLAALNAGLVDRWPAPTPYPVAVPWLNVGIALLVVPLIAMLGAGLLTRSRLPIERRL